MDNLIPNFSKVRLKDNHKVEGTTIGIAISGKNNDVIEYRVVFWMGTERKDTWVFEFEIELVPKKEPIGFRKPTDNGQILLK